MSDDDYANTFDEIINKPVDESSIPADTMQVIRNGVEDDKKRVRAAFWNVLVVLKRCGFTVKGTVALLDKYPDGIAKQYYGRAQRCPDGITEKDIGWRWLVVERIYDKIDLGQQDVPPVLRSYFIEEFEKLPVEPVEWLVEDFIPANTVSGFFGDGGTGKDRTLMLLAAAVACDKNWLGKKVKHGRALYYNVEDDDKELNRRRAAIAEHYDIKTFTDFSFSKRLKGTSNNTRFRRFLP